MKRALLCLLTFAILPCVAEALALGQIELRSHLNQRLDARIALHSLAAADAGDLRVALADKSAFDSAGLPRTHVLSQLRFDVITQANGKSYISVSSKQGIKEPSLRFIVALQSPQGQLMREYSLLLETGS